VEEKGREPDREREKGSEIFKLPLQKSGKKVLMPEGSCPSLKEKKKRRNRLERSGLFTEQWEEGSRWAALEEGKEGEKRRTEKLEPGEIKGGKKREGSSLKKKDAKHGQLEGYIRNCNTERLSTGRRDGRWRKQSML